MFQRVPGEIHTLYVVVGIGEGFEVSSSSLPQTIPFRIVQGEPVTTNANYTFGFLNAMVDTDGVQTATSAGTVDYNVGFDSGEGVGGAGTTNDWTEAPSATYVDSQVAVALGTTFGYSGSGATFSFYDSRTYSALVYGVVSTTSSTSTQ